MRTSLQCLNNNLSVGCQTTGRSRENVDILLNYYTSQWVPQSISNKKCPDCFLWGKLSGGGIFERMFHCDGFFFLLHFKFPCVIRGNRLSTSPSACEQTDEHGLPHWHTWTYKRKLSLSKEANPVTKLSCYHLFHYSMFLCTFISCELCFFDLAVRLKLIC